MTNHSATWNRSAHALSARPWSESTKEQVLRGLRQEGIVLLQGLEPTVEAFEEVTGALGEEFVIHPETSRDSVGSDGTTQTVTYGNEAVPLHAERAFFPGRPTTLYFMCIAPPKTGGETIVCDGAAIIDQLSEDVRSLVGTRRFRYEYVATMPLWQRMLQTTEQAVAEQKLKSVTQSLGSDEKFEYEFVDGVLKYRYVLPIANKTRFGDRTAFANSFFYLAPLREPNLWDAYLRGASAQELGRTARLVNTTLDDGKPFPREAAEAIVSVATRLTAAIEWRVGDLIIIDNTRFLHGRNAFEGDRRILVRTSTTGPKL